MKRKNVPINQLKLFFDINQRSLNKDCEENVTNIVQCGNAKINMIDYEN